MNQKFSRRDFLKLSGLTLGWFGFFTIFARAYRF
ncbi:MAG TPA: hypothetical protein DIW23_06075 [Anaerolineae bacterium]|nr:hypothetical protein [Anaerolineae bacterium]